MTGEYRTHLGKDLIPTSSVRWTVTTGKVDFEDVPERRQGWFLEPLRGDPHFTAALRIELTTDGQLTVIEVRVFPTAWLETGEVGAWGLFEHPPHTARRLTAKALRTLQLRPPVEDTREILDEFTHTFPEAAQYLRSYGLVVEEPQRGEGRAGFPPRYYAQLASAYVDEHNRGNPRPVATLADRYGLTQAVVRDRLHRARELRLLTKGRQGIPGGRLTKKAEKLLEE